MIVDKYLFDYFYDSIANGGVPDCPKCQKPQSIVPQNYQDRQWTLSECDTCGIQYKHSLEMNHREIYLHIPGLRESYAIVWEDDGCAIWLRGQGISKTRWDHITDINGSDIDIATIDLAMVQKIIILL
jgi:hypothetical protein